ncbi:GNAT family N-acetyltransferase [Gordoniibacillus kamchatkensis]|uniref:GNAT family N-acetyltransferase n=1 Tax=Gordoniibacillus kamchatkensis TaxID=1590651 RepID=UPI0012E03CAD|nr:GNAT family N-acetyltransferase [Paenibacillus sp. VKM B-2647]
MGWIHKGLKESNVKELIDNLIEYLRDEELPGVAGEPEFIKELASSYSHARGVSHEINMTMESYFCPKVIAPIEVEGTINKAGHGQIETVAEFLAGFSVGASGIAVEPSSQLAAAEKMVQRGNLYLLFVDGTPVSMAQIAHRSARHARINAVYTPPQHRKQGFASGLVAKLCKIIKEENLVPMLYADLNNPDSNKIYKNIGFLACGKIMDIKFTK